MAKSDAIETTLNALAALRAGGKNATALVALTNALSSKNNLVVKRVMRIFSDRSKSRLRDGVALQSGVTTIVFILLFAPPVSALPVSALPVSALRPNPLPPPPAPAHTLGPARGGSFEERSTASRRIEDDLDRGAGHVIDEPRFRLDQFDRLSQIRAHPFDASLRRELFAVERDRDSRIDAKQLAEPRERARSEAQQREAEMKLREYDLFINADIGGSPIARQAEADRIEMQNARNARDEKVNAARRTERFDEVKRDAEDAYQKERARILGYPTSDEN